MLPHDDYELAVKLIKAGGWGILIDGPSNPFSGYHFEMHS